jgi:hypothetical protein
MANVVLSGSQEQSFVNSLPSLESLRENKEASTLFIMNSTHWRDESGKRSLFYCRARYPSLHFPYSLLQQKLSH